MAKKLIFLLATIGLLVNVSGCTSNKSQDDAQVVENADVDKIDSEDAKTIADSGAATTTPDGTDPSLQAALGETPSTSVTPDGTTLATNDALALDTTPPPSDVAATETVATPGATDLAAAPTLDENSLKTDVPPPATTPDVMASTPPVENTAPTPMATDTAPTVAANDTPTEQSAATEVTAPVMHKPKVAKSSSLKKISQAVPYQHGNGWVNTVYIARPGETLKQISQTIFSADKTKDLKKIAENSYLKSRSVKPGDKIYYVSPNRPDDSTKTILYYEDMGMVPETYVAQKGDKLKKVAKKILGYDKAWIEMWTANSIDSQTSLNEGDTLRYWRSASSISTVAQHTDKDQAHLIDQSSAAAMGMGQEKPKEMAHNGMNPDMNAAPPQPGMEAHPNMQAANTPPPAADNSLPPPPPPAEMAPPPPPPDAGATGQVAANTPPPAPDNGLPPPPPPPAEMAPPPPPSMDAAGPVKPHKKKSTGDEEAAGGLDNDTLISLGAVGVLTAALAFVLIRRKKKKAAELAAASEPMEHHVGT